jgi:hypothetical protein
MNALFRLSGRRCLVTAIALLLIPSSVLAQLPTAQLKSLSPPGAQAGTTVEVTLSGSNLDESTQLIFSHTGIQAEILETAAGPWDSSPQLSFGKFKVTVAGDVPAGSYDAWAKGRYGESNPRSFVIGTLPEATDNGANRALTSPQTIILNSVLNGITDANSVDYYAVELEQGQTVLIECAAEYVDSRADPLVAVMGPNGLELARDNNAMGHDAVVSLTVKQNGIHVISVRDLVYGGGSDFFYRLKVHTGPRIDFVVPSSGQAGVTGSYTVYGRNLPGGQPSDFQLAGGIALQQLTVQATIPAAVDELKSVSYLGSNQMTLDGQPVSLGAAGSHWLGVTKDPVVLEQPVDNNDEANAQLITIPTEVAGQFYPARDRDWYAFEAKKGDVFWIDVISHRLGLRVDPALTVMRVDEKASAQIAAVDDTSDRKTKIQGFFDTSSDDPSYRFVADRDATFRVLVRDQFGGTVNDASRIYRLRIRREAPDFQLFATPQQLKATGTQVLPSTIAIRQGETVLLQVQANRIGNFSGEIKLAVEGIPESIVVSNAVITAGKDNDWTSLRGKADAAPRAGPLKIVGTADVNGSAVARNCRCGSVVWDTGNKTTQPAVYRVADQLRLSIIGEVTPAAVEVTQIEITTSRGGTVDVPLKLHRKEGYAETVKFVATNIPGEVKPADVSIDGKVSEGTLKVVISNAKAKAGSYLFYLKADTKTKYQRNPEAHTRAEQDLKKLDEKLNAAKEVVKGLTESVAASKTALGTATDEGKAEIQKKIEELEAQLKAKQEIVTQGEAAKKTKTANVATLKKSAGAKDVNFSVYSPMIRLTVVDSPLELELPEMIEVKKGGTVDLPTKILKRFGFAEATKLTVEVDGKTGLSAAAVDVAADKETGTLSIVAKAEAAPSEVTLTVVVSAKFNKLAVTTKKKIIVKIVE